MNQIRNLKNDGLEWDYKLQQQYFGVNVIDHDFNDIQEDFYEDVVMKNKISFEVQAQIYLGK